MNYDWLDAILAPKREERHQQETSHRIFNRKDVETKEKQLIDISQSQQTNDSHSDKSNSNNTKETTTSISFNYSFRPSFSKLKVVNDEVVYEDDGFSNPISSHQFIQSKKSKEMKEIKIEKDWKEIIDESNSSSQTQSTVTQLHPPQKILQFEHQNGEENSQRKKSEHMKEIMKK